MPYIVKDMREKVEPAIKCLIEMADFTDDEIEGVMNYVITTLLNKAMKREAKWRYKWINRVVGVLECAKLEFYRRIAAEREDNAIASNGEIEVYEPRNR